MYKNSELDALWACLEDELDRHAPDLLHSLRPPAKEDFIAECESRMGICLPNDVRHAYLRHDGSEYPQGPRRDVEPLGLFGRLRWLPLADVLACHAEMCDFALPDEPYFHSDIDCASMQIRPWHEPPPPHWIPIGKRLSSSLCWFVDMCPASAGRAGQVVSYNTEGGAPGCWLVASSLSGYLKGLTEGLQRNEVRPAIIGDRLEFIWQVTASKQEFVLPEHAHAFGFE